jgi:glycine/D-amino acid oxidase-like deaminating enzyme
MTRRATLRGAERTPLDTRADVLICGASFAGLAVARELAGSGADVLVLDRYEVGERATSAYAAPTCSSSTATRSASARRPPARRRRRGSTGWVSSARSARSSRA